MRTRPPTTKRTYTLFPYTTVFRSKKSKREGMETTAIIRGVHISAQKTRLVADLVRGKSVSQALNILTFTPKKAAGIVKKALESAIANAEHNDGADIDELKVTTIYVDKGQSMKRSEEHTSELQSLMRISYAGFC